MRSPASSCRVYSSESIPTRFRFIRYSPILGRAPAAAFRTDRKHAQSRLARKAPVIGLALAAKCNRQAAELKNSAKAPNLSGRAAYGRGERRSERSDWMLLPTDPCQQAGIEPRQPVHKHDNTARQGLRSQQVRTAARKARQGSLPRHRHAGAVRHNEVVTLRTQSSPRGQRLAVTISLAAQEDFRQDVYSGEIGCPAGHSPTSTEPFPRT